MTCRAPNLELKWAHNSLHQEHTHTQLAWHFHPALNIIEHECICSSKLGATKVGCPGEAEAQSSEVAQGVGHEKKRRYDWRDNVQTPESKRPGVRAGVG